MTDDECSCSHSDDEESSAGSEELQPMRQAPYFERTSLDHDSWYTLGRHCTFRARIAEDNVLVVSQLRPRHPPRIVARFEEYLGFWLVEADETTWLTGFMIVRINEWLYVLIRHDGAPCMSPFQTDLADEEIESVHYCHSDNGSLCILARTPTHEIILPEEFRLPRPTPIQDEQPTARDYYRICTTPEEISVYVFDQEAANGLGESFDWPLSGGADDMAPWTSAALLQNTSKKHYERSDILTTRAC